MELSTPFVVYLCIYLLICLSDLCVYFFDSLFIYLFIVSFVCLFISFLLFSFFVSCVIYLSNVLDHKAASGVSRTKPQCYSGFNRTSARFA